MAARVWGGWIVVASLLASAVPSPGRAADAKSLVDEVRTGCSEELAKYCSQVTPGEGRQLACLYAHGDKLSGRCEYALYDASVQLERAVGAITYVARECQDDIESHCAKIEPGGGRILDCLQRNSAKLSSRCTTALSDVGAK